MHEAIPQPNLDTPLAPFVRPTPPSAFPLHHSPYLIRSFPHRPHEHSLPSLAPCLSDLVVVVPNFRFFFLPLFDLGLFNFSVTTTISIYILTNQGSLIRNTTELRRAGQKSCIRRRMCTSSVALPPLVSLLSLYVLVPHVARCLTINRAFEHYIIRKHQVNPMMIRRWPVRLRYLLHVWCSWNGGV